MSLTIAHLKAVQIMRGDYEFDQWMYLVVSNKTFLWLVSISLIGGSTGLVCYKLAKKIDRVVNNEEGKVSEEESKKRHKEIP